MDQTDLVVLRVFITLLLSQSVLCSSDGGNSIARLQKRIRWGRCCGVCMPSVTRAELMTGVASSQIAILTYTLINSLIYTLKEQQQESG